MLSDKKMYYLCVFFYLSGQILDTMRAFLFICMCVYLLLSSIPMPDIRLVNHFRAVTDIELKTSSRVHMLSAFVVLFFLGEGN